MSKKKFTSGLESLFLDDDQMRDSSPFLAKTEEEGNVLTSEARPARQVRKKKRSGKSFSSDLESLFIQKEEKQHNTNTEEVIKPSDKATAPLRRRTPRRRAVSGLDSLIRKTIDLQPEDNEPRYKKRLTFVLDRDNLTKLKSIAKTEKKYLKDILGGVISEYIEKYETEKGTISSN